MVKNDRGDDRRKSCSRQRTSGSVQEEQGDDTTKMFVTILLALLWTVPALAQSEDVEFLFDADALESSITETTDTDGDGVYDIDDNCTTKRNADQTDADGDGYGNRCDTDFDQSGKTLAPDWVEINVAFGTDLTTPWDEDPNQVYDIDNSGGIYAPDIIQLMGNWAGVPGPSHIDLEKELYANCGGSSLYPAPFCDDGSCLNAGLERRTYDLWKTRFLTVHGLTQAQFDERIEIGRVKIIGQWLFIDYVFVAGWARSWQHKSVDLASLDDDTDDATIIVRIDRMLKPAHRYDHTALSSFTELPAIFDSCEAQMFIDYCDIDFERAGELQVSANKVIDFQANECKLASVELAAGVLFRCWDVVCFKF